VKYVTREADVGQQLAALVNKAVDVQGNDRTDRNLDAAKRLRREVALVSRRDPVYQEGYWGVSRGSPKTIPTSS